MSETSCDMIQEKLLDAADRSLDADAVRHLAECPRCRRFNESLQTVDRSLRELAQVSPASGVVESLLEQVRQEPPMGATNRPPRGNRRLRIRQAGGLVALAAVLLLTLNLPIRKATLGDIGHRWRARQERTFSSIGSSIGSTGYGGSANVAAAPDSLRDGLQGTDGASSIIEQQGHDYRPSDKAAGEISQGRYKANVPAGAPTGSFSDAEGLASDDAEAPPSARELRYSRELENAQRELKQRPLRTQPGDRREAGSSAVASADERDALVEKFEALAEEVDELAAELQAADDVGGSEGQRAGARRRRTKEENAPASPPAEPAAARTSAGDGDELIEAFKNDIEDQKRSARPTEGGFAGRAERPQTTKKDRTAGRPDQSPEEEEQTQHLGAPGSGLKVGSEHSRTDDTAFAANERSQTAGKRLPRQSGQIAGGIAAGLQAPEPAADKLAAKPQTEKKVMSKESAMRPSEEPSIPSTSEAESFLQSLKRTDHLKFQEASGYWANTYLPGDPVVRSLRSQLELFDRDPSHAASQLIGPVREGFDQPPQPFDQPTAGSLGVYLQSDEPAIQGETRMLVQVGLQGINRSRGQRPAMNLAVVVDYRGGRARQRAAIVRELLLALARAEDVGDRFRIYFAGCEEIDIANPADFKFGAVTVALQKLESCGANGTVERPLEAVLPLAINAVRESDDDRAPLGSSAVILVTGGDISSSKQFLLSSAHVAATDGVPVSVMSLDAGPVSTDLKRVAYSGQGSFRSVTRPEEAEAQLRRELFAVSEVVARAVRLRIRLAPGVKLVDVLGSERLDAPRAEQVREVERAIDRRVSKSMGIEADRGDDEEGIQIVIPAYYQGDSHVILLDVVAPGPGAIADVTVRYKDLVNLKNNVARANLSVASGSGTRGALERNVLKNRVAHHVAQQLRYAATLLRSGSTAAAKREIDRTRDLLAGLSAGGHGFGRDADLHSDIAALEQVARLISVPQLSRDHLAKTLAYSSYRKLMTKPGRE